MRKAEPIAGLGGLILIVALPFGPDVLHILLFAYGLLALAVPVVSVTTSGPAKSIATAVLASTFGPIAIVLAAITGDWLAIAGAIVAWVGSWLSMRDESTPGAEPPEVPRLPAPS